ETFTPQDHPDIKASPAVRKLAADLRIHLTEVMPTGPKGEITEKDVEYVADRKSPGLLMFKVKLGQPRNKQLLRMMEDPEKRKASEFTTSRNCCAPIACSRRTCSTWWKKTKSSSWTNIPAEKCRGGGGAMGCIRRWKQRKRCKSIAKRKPSLPLRFKIISGFIKNWPG